MNGQRVFVDSGKVVGGVNNLAVKAVDKKAATENSEVVEIKKKNEAFEAHAAAEKEHNQQKERIQKANYFDGLIHEPNGKMRFVDNGDEVSGVNTIAQVASKHKHASLAHHKTATKKHHGKKHHAKKMPRKQKVHSDMSQE